MRNWAEEILALSPAERASTTAFSPFVPDPESGRLRLINEIRRTRKDGFGFPVAPAPGWTELMPGTMMWCPLGAQNVLSGAEPPKRVINPEGGRLDLNWQLMLRLISLGQAFVFCGDLFMLPDIRQFVMNSFNYELQPEPLSIFVGYRGHTKRYSEILSPGIYRAHKNPSQESFTTYKQKAIYAGNCVKQAFWANEAVALDNVRACGVLQHHGTVGATDILDLSYDVNVAKWFALNEWDDVNRCYKSKIFHYHEDEEDLLDEASYIYKVVVRVLGGTRDPLPLKIHGQEVRLLPWNLNPLWSTRPQAQRGFGVWGLGVDDFDKFGAVLSVTEARYHPHGFETGWDHIGGTGLTIDGSTFSCLEDSSSLQDVLFPSEETWLTEALESAKRGIAKLEGKV